MLSSILDKADQPEAHEDKVSGAEAEAEDVPVNKITSFNGKLNKYLHANGTAAVQANKPTSPLKRDLSTNGLDDREDEPRTSDGTPSPKRAKPATQSTITTPTAPISSAVTYPRLTRSRSSPTTPSPTRRKRKPPPTHTPAASDSLLRDTIPPNLILLLVGVNPGLLTGTTGFAYAHPSNLFWKLLHSSGITSIRHPPSDTYKLPELYSVGNTNIVERPTRDASMLSKAEMDAGVPVLEAKVAAQRPEAVCLVGKSIWEAVWRVRHGRAIRKEEFRYGWQSEEENMGCTTGSDWAGAPVFVATTTSGLAAGMTIAQKEAVWAELGNWVAQRRTDRELLTV
ncbi:uncharacterized protein N7459_000099 [Penicillium hispanicum]|uniref:uncharacterized protein n=1 Tax=Penicillium hispanicum TaxID=1080232 RepID=UPI00254205EE|nr:uncharacterized protein N7459_000099 [Penicillium hispanicum]KAJ5593891.1 hypothetical protein N7459_000099 [Penicillium hispanicum]